MYHVSAQGIDERMINVHYYYYYDQSTGERLALLAPSSQSYVHTNLKPLKNIFLLL